MGNKESRDNDRDSRDYSSNNQPRELAWSTLLDREINRTAHQPRERVSVREPVREAGEDRGNNRESKHDLTNAITPTSEAKQPDEKKLKISTTLESDKNIAKEAVGTEKTSQTSSKSDSSSTIKEVPAELEKIPSTPAFTGKMNRAVVGVIQTKLHKRFPFAANDPRFNLVMTAIDAGVTIGTGAALGAAWPEILLLLEVNALVNYAVPLVVNKFRNWIFTDDYKIMDTGSQNLPIGSINCFLFPKADFNGRRDDLDPYKFPVGSSRYMIDPYGYLVQYRKVRLRDAEVYSKDSTVNREYGIMVGMGGVPFSYETIKGHKVPVVSDFLFSRQILHNGKWINTRGLKEIDLSNYESKTASNAIADLPEEIFQEKLSPDMLALASNSVWRSANLEGQSENLSWSVDDPITVEDVQEWLDLHPDLAPTVGDFVAPAAPPGATSISFNFSTNANSIPMSMPSVVPNSAAEFTPVSNVVPDASYDAASKEPSKSSNNQPGWSVLREPVEQPEKKFLEAIIDREFNRTENSPREMVTIREIAKEPVETEKTSQLSSKSDSSSTIKEVPAELRKIDTAGNLARTEQEQQKSILDLSTPEKIKIANYIVFKANPDSKRGVRHLLRTLGVEEESLPSEKNPEKISQISETMMGYAEVKKQSEEIINQAILLEHNRKFEYSNMDVPFNHNISSDKEFPINFLKNQGNEFYVESFESNSDSFINKKLCAPLARQVLTPISAAVDIAFTKGYLTAGYTGTCVTLKLAEEHENIHNRDVDIRVSAEAVLKSSDKMQSKDVNNEKKNIINHLPQEISTFSNNDSNVAGTCTKADSQNQHNAIVPAYSDRDSPKSSGSR